MYEGFGDFESNQFDLLYEMENYGLKRIDDFDKIIPSDYLNIIKQLNLKLNFLGTIRVIMIINDSKKYTENYLKFKYRNFWDITCLQDMTKLFSKYNISIEEVITEATQK